MISGLNHILSIGSCHPVDYLPCKLHMIRNPVSKWIVLHRNYMISIHARYDDAVSGSVNLSDVTVPTPTGLTEPTKPKCTNTTNVENQMQAR